MKCLRPAEIPRRCLDSRTSLCYTLYIAVRCIEPQSILASIEDTEQAEWVFAPVNRNGMRQSQGEKDAVLMRYFEIELCIRRCALNAHIRKVYVPMTETGFYILLCLQRPNHGYGIVQQVEALTDGEIRLTPGTMYGSLSKMEKDGLIQLIQERDKRKIYQITALGAEVLELELRRIERLYRTAQEARNEKLEDGISILHDHGL